MFKRFNFIKRLGVRFSATCSVPVSLNFMNTNLVELALLASDEEREAIKAEEYRITAVLRLPAPIHGRGKQKGMIDFRIQVLGPNKERSLKVQVMHNDLDQPIELPLLENHTHEYYLSFPVSTERRGGMLLNAVVLIDPIGA